MEAVIRQLLCYLQLKVLVMDSPVPESHSCSAARMESFEQLTTEVLCCRENSLFHRAVEELKDSWLFALLRMGGREGGRQGQR